ncbi:hypothetical protein LWI29_009613 [Acer saccharum]|uniref:RNase H type-1 domain-containing protein n=1 Tax=Acer saccharum TaxID=4024 RepID=A0AA39SKA5_ACESA|nr:hypothetical protein LWI29_009613 [Acer saccharum]
MDSWLGLCPAANYKEVWSILFSAVTWTVWDHRNNQIFRGQEASVEKAVDDVKFRVAWWFKSYGRGSKIPVSLMLLNLKESCVSLTHLKSRTHVNWLPPVGSVLKFNVDGSARGKPGPAGIGGILRNSEGLTLCRFSIAVGIQSSNTAEIIAIRKACELCESNPSLVSRNIQIASDSSVAVSWANSTDNFGSLPHVQIIYDIRGYLQSLKGLSIVYNPRASNEAADALAKASSSGGEDFVVWEVL